VDNEALVIAVAVVAAYLIGSFPAPYIVARLRKGIDIREVGSRNMGAANVMYQVGPVEGILVLVVDVGKGAAALLLARWLGVPPVVEFVAGAAVVAGHAFPVYLKFRGGKGGAALLGALAVLMPQAIPWYLGFFLVALVVSRFPTFSFSVSLLSVPFMAWLIYHSGPLIVFVVVMEAILCARYIPRMKEMYARAGGWRRVILRRSLRERL
jgi:glycerol-3-phosphate acyltransferase PlsY